MYKSLAVGNLFLVRWEAAELGDSLKIAADVDKAAKQVGGLVNYIAIAPREMEPPEDRARAEMAQIAKDRLLKSCSRVFLVVEERGFKGAVVRMVATGMFLLIGKRERVSVFESLETALAKCDDLSVSVATILSSARAKNLIV